MEGGSAEVVVTGPRGAPAESITLTGNRVTVGRLPELNDIPLQPDPELYVSRTTSTAANVKERAGCSSMEGVSTKGSSVRRGAEVERIGRKAALRDGDVVCILAAIETDGARRYLSSPTDRSPTRSGRAPLRFRRSGT